MIEKGVADDAEAESPKLMNVCVKADTGSSSSIQVLNGILLNGPQLQQLSNHQQLQPQSAAINSSGINTTSAGLNNSTSTPSQRLLSDHRIARKVRVTHFSNDYINRNIQFL